MNTADYKREYLYRKAQGRVLFNKYREKIEFLLNITIDVQRFLSLSETDKLIATLKDMNEYRQNIQYFDSFSELAIFIHKKKTSSCYLLIDDEWKYCGAYKIEMDTTFNVFFDFNCLSSDEIRIIDTSFNYQFQIDYDGGEISCQLIEYTKLKS